MRHETNEGALLFLLWCSSIVLFYNKKALEFSRGNCPFSGHLSLFPHEVCEIHVLSHPIALNFSFFETAYFLDFCISASY